MAIKRLYDTLVGATVAMNQLADNANAPTNRNGMTIAGGSDGFTINGTATKGTSMVGWFNLNSTEYQEYIRSSGHKVLVEFNLLSGTVVAAEGTTDTIYLHYGDGVSIVPFGTSKIAIPQLRADSKATLYVYPGTVFTNAKFTIQCIDLTQMFGSSIADCLYNLETATAGAGIAKLREWGFFTGEYIPYNPGSLESVEARSHVMRGFNQWDEEWRLGAYNGQGVFVANYSFICSKNPIRVLPNYTYSTSTTIYAWFYDKDMNFLEATSSGIVPSGTFTVPSGASYMHFRNTVESTTYNHDICINLSSSRNGEYEPYSTHTYDLGTDTLRGLFKLDSNNNLYADGDTKTSDGTITRHYGTRAYQSGDESLPDAITDGTTTVYKLTTPTTEQGDPFTNPQICDPDGTEEYVTSNGIPVGHETRYQL